MNVHMMQEACNAPCGRAMGSAWVAREGAGQGREGGGAVGTRGVWIHTSYNIITEAVLKIQNCHGARRR
jgi:hypothetical protein